MDGMGGRPDIMGESEREREGGDMERELSFIGLLFIYFMVKRSSLLSCQVEDQGTGQHGNQNKILYRVVPNMLA